MNTSKNRPETSRKSRPSKSKRTAEFPAVTPPEPAPPLFTVRPLNPADVRIGAVLKTVDGCVGTIKAIGKHRVRLIFADGRPPAVLLKGQLGELVTPAAPKSSSRKAGPKGIRIAGDAGVPAIVEALEGSDIPAERMLAALEQAIAKLKSTK